jgi:allantoin racemase
MCRVGDSGFLCGAAVWRTKVANLLVVNPNTSPTATRHISEACNPYLRETTRATYVTAPAGAEAIDTPLDVAIAALEVGRIIAANRESYDAFVIAAGDDPGLDIARQFTDRPVVGIAEAGMLVACTLGARFSVFTALRCEVTKTAALVAKYGLSSRLASILTVEPAAGDAVTSATLINDPRRSFERFATESERAIRDDMAEVIVMIGSVMAGLAQPLTERVGVPVLSGTICGVKLAETLAELQVKTSHAFTYDTPVKGDKLVGYPEFNALYSR